MEKELNRTVPFTARLLFRSLPFSIGIHLLLITLIGLNLQRAGLHNPSVPKQWKMDVDIVLEEKELQLPSAGVQDAAREWTAPSAVPEQRKEESIPAEPKEIKNEIAESADTKKSEDALKALNEQVQMQAKQMQDAMAARVNLQFLIFHIKAFFKNARLSILSFIFSEANEGKRNALNGSSAIVKLEYDENGKLKIVNVSSESEELKNTLEKISWHAVPLPSNYFLAYKGLNLKITIANGIPVVGIEAL